MKVGDAIAEILKREGIELLFGYPVNHTLEHAAVAGIRPVIVRQERTGLHMADAISRLSSGRTIGAFAMQSGPGTENSYGGIAQAYSESVPILVMPSGYARRMAHVDPHYFASRSMRDVTKSAEPITSAKEIPAVFRRAFSRLRNGRGGPVLVEIPADLWAEDVPEPLDYRPVLATKFGPDPEAVREAADLLLSAKRPVLYAGQGIHYARAWPQLKALAERLAIPVCTSLEGKSAFPEDHPLALGSGGAAIPKTVRHFLDAADVIFGVGCSFTETPFGVAMPKARKTVIHATLDPDHVNKEYEATVALVGDAGLTLDALAAELDRRGEGTRPHDAVAAEIADVHAGWLAEWMPKLTSEEAPLSPYRVLWDLQHTVDVERTIITHDAGSPRDQLSPFWVATAPLTYLGWGKSTQLGYGLGLAMGAKLARPDMLCINVWGDAAIGFTGMDFETAVRERIPILSILLNNFSMAMELPIMEVSTEKYRATDISGNYAAFAEALGGYGERVTDPAEIVPAIRRAIAKTEAGVPALLEFITAKELALSKYPAI
ncbi:thiamine pyrophosphate-requiring protein [Amorphus orientalis]|uniref:Acetolactate synthase-1/2/3 large subunit n=1 Tax=Amorphus orientalis TaxID=649198 RepID=A0AAE3VM54_9HYPH|nr:thiamine pyrophosphate-requiring protein [Amorphus orientalis]MDQ0314582.1 acetolactate synthase-1/2/3 large subunit [Amorphus orientalis]